MWTNTDPGDHSGAKTHTNIQLKSVSSGLRICQTKLIFGHQIDYLSRHTKPVKTKNSFQDSYRYGGHSPAVILAIEQLCAEHAASPCFGCFCKNSVCLRRRPPSPSPRGSHRLERKFRFECKFRAHKIWPDFDFKKTFYPPPVGTTLAITVPSGAAAGPPAREATLPREKLPATRSRMGGRQAYLVASAFFFEANKQEAS